MNGFQSLLSREELSDNRFPDIVFLQKTAEKREAGRVDFGCTENGRFLDADHEDHRFFNSANVFSRLS
jgi:hypothetical protein